MLTRNDIVNLVGDKGLTAPQVTTMRQRFGRNEMTPPKREPLWKQYLKEYDNPIIKILLVALCISFAIAIFHTDTFFDTVGILVAVILATAISFFNEYRSSKEFEVLNAHRDDISVKAIRDGRPNLIPSREIVVGDLILIEAGDAIPADGWVLSSDNLFIDEAVFTGESEPVVKRIDDVASKGSYVTEGKGTLLASAVGDSAEMGAVAATLGIEHSTPTPLEQKLIELARLISKFGYAMALLIGLALFIRGVFIGEITGVNQQSFTAILYYFMIAVVIVVVAVPEGLPVSVTLSLSLAMRKMTRAKCLVRKLIACETIGSATLICTDKTGTLTKNQMEVVASSIGSPSFTLALPRTPHEWITLNAAVNGTAHLQDHDGKILTIGNSTEGALLRWLRDHSIDYHHIRREVPAWKQYLFDANRKMMSTVVEIEGKKWLLVKGAPELLASLSNQHVDLAGIKALSSRAMRVLGFAHKEIVDGKEDESGLTWDGYVGIRDQLRDEIADSIASCRNAGIHVMMITGDNIETAKAIAKEVGILTSGSIITGREFRELHEQQRISAARNLEVMARANPLDKLHLVRALQKDGHVVAVTGDGINDAPALKNADVGLSMGISGTDVAREASDIVLMDDSFATITRAVLWGRSLYENIQRFIQFQLTINFSACILAFVAPLLGYPEPFTIPQLLWINIIMDTVAAFALCSEAPHARLLQRSPIPREAHIITPPMWKSIVVTAAFYIIIGLVHLETGFLGGTTIRERSTVFFAAFVIAQVWNGINCRAINAKMPPFFKGNPIFFAVMGIIVAIQVILIQYGGTIFGTAPLSFETWLRIFVLSSSVLVVGQLLRFSESV